MSEEAKRAIERMEAEQEKLLGPGERPQALDDPIEKWGTRIGRILGYIVAAGLVFYLWFLLRS